MLPRVEFKSFKLYFEPGKLVPQMIEKELRRGVVIGTIVKTFQRPFYHLTDPEMSGLMPPQDTTFLIVACEDDGEIFEVEICEARYLDPDKHHPPLVQKKPKEYCVTYQIYKKSGAELPRTRYFTFAGDDDHLVKKAWQYICRNYCPDKDFVITSVEPQDHADGA